MTEEGTAGAIANTREDKGGEGKKDVKSLGGGRGTCKGRSSLRKARTRFKYVLPGRSVRCREAGQGSK